MLAALDRTEEAFKRRQLRLADHSGSGGIAWLLAANVEALRADVARDVLLRLAGSAGPTPLRRSAPTEITTSPATALTKTPVQVASTVLPSGPQAGARGEGFLLS